MARRPVVLLVDDHPLVRETLRSRLEASGCDVLDTGSPMEAGPLSASAQPDVAVVDIELPDMSGFEVVTEIGRRSPTTRVLLLSAFVRDAYIDRALELEVAGYITKSEPPEVLMEAVMAVAQGAERFSDDVRARIIIEGGNPRSLGRGASRRSALTEREMEVLVLVARGLPQKQVASQLGISIKTVQHHLDHVMDKLGIHDRVDLARFAIREGLIEP